MSDCAACIKHLLSKRGDKDFSLSLGVVAIATGLDPLRVVQNYTEGYHELRHPTILDYWPAEP